MSSLDAVRARFARNEGLPFADILTEASIREVLNEHGVLYRDRLFSPMTTIWGFLSQVLSEDHSCRDAVSRIIAHRAANGVTVCSPNTASYCNARSRIPTSVLSTLAKRTAEELHASVDDRWKWNGRSVFILDGSCGCRIFAITRKLCPRPECAASATCMCSVHSCAMWPS